MIELRLVDLVERFGGQLIGDGEVKVSGIAPLEQAGPQHLSFLSNAKLRTTAASSKAAALILSATDDAIVSKHYVGSRIVTVNPYAYFARVATLFANSQAAPFAVGIHPTACVDPSAVVASTAHIGPHVVVSANAMIDAHAIIEAACFIGRGARVGESTHLFAHVTLHAACEIGARGIVHSGAVIGADGFGFANDDGKWIKIPQTGRVMIADDVEIGANTCIDRGALNDTVIEEGVKLDNQIQIGHNCRIGAHSAMAGCVGIAGSTVIGKHCTFGGAAMVLGHLTIADKVHISSGTMVTKSISEPGQYTGFYPIAKNAEWEKSAVAVRNLGKMREKIRALEKTLTSLAEKK